MILVLLATGIRCRGTCRQLSMFTRSLPHVTTTERSLTARLAKSGSTA